VVDSERVETTSYSLSDAAPEAAERRSGERHITLFRVGALVIDGRRELCLIKNISGGGMMLRLYCSVQPGQPIGIELKNGVPVSGKVSWVRGDQVGVTFDTPIDVLEVLANDSSGPTPRMPRIEASAIVFVRHGASTHRVKMCDVSQGGVKVEPSVDLPIDAEVVVTLGGLAPQPGVVRWFSGGYAGISFNRPLPLPELVSWLQTQRRESRAA
jgi:hypothetical protein